MRKSTIIAALCALWVIGGTTGPTAARAETITIFHGTKAEIFDTVTGPADFVHIARPAIAPATTPLPTAARRAARPHAVKTTFAAGDTLWTRNARSGRLVACTVGSSGMVGKRIIRCTGPDSFGR